MPNIILINPNYYEDIYSQSKSGAAIGRAITPLGLVTLAGSVIKNNHKVKILDFNLINNNNIDLKKEINSFRPDFIGITSTTPLIKNVYKLTEEIKKISNSIQVIAGGPHPTAMPEDILKESRIDCVVFGEGDNILPLILKDGINDNIPNLYYKKDNIIYKSNIQNEHIKDLDIFPFPAYELLEINKYVQPRVFSRNSPVGSIETSRGCYAACIFCNKNIHGYKVRMKSPKRVVDEMEYILQIGFREIHIIDDIFTANVDRVYEICEEILRRNLKFSWYPRGGIRVDTVNLKLLKIMRKAGCYRIPFGIESGSKRILEIIRKKITKEQAIEAVKYAKKAGMIVETYFMIGLPGETEEDINESINFAIQLNTDYAKFAITTPLPGTPMFDSMMENGQIKTKDWDKYNFAYPAKEIYSHDTLSWDILEKYYSLSHKKFYFRINYILKSLLKSIMNGNLISLINTYFKTKW